MSEGCFHRTLLCLYEPLSRIMGSVPPSFELIDEPIENMRPLKVRVIGAGYSGIYLGIRIPQRLRNVDLKIYDKNAAIGGTWFENRYPGCACDIPCKSSKVEGVETTLI